MFTLIVYKDKKTEKNGFCLKFNNVVLAFGKNYISKVLCLPIDIMDNLNTGLYQLKISTVDYIKKF